MPIDVHAHYVPLKLLDVLEREGARFGVKVVEHEPTCQKCLRFEYGLQVRPFFAKLVEPVEARIDSMRRISIDREILSAWADIFAYALPSQKGEAWHRLLNDLLAEFCAANAGSFSWLASGPLPDAARRARARARCKSRRRRRRAGDACRRHEPRRIAA